MALTSKEPQAIRHGKEFTQSAGEIGSPVVAQFYHQEVETDIEHTIVEDDPRKWGNVRKVSTIDDHLRVFDVDLLVADRRSCHCLGRIYDRRLSRQHTKS